MWLRSKLMAGGLALVAAACALIAYSHAATATRSSPSGIYLESRTCDVYTGPCFANAQTGQAGRQALLAWSIERGDLDGVDLTGLNVVMAVRANDTLGFADKLSADDPTKSVVLVDERADEAQRLALVEFAKRQAGQVAGKVVRVAPLAIEIEVDSSRKVARLKAGDEASLETRAVRSCDCVCSNESVYYPPLSEVASSSPAVTVDGGFGGHGLGDRWANPGTRSAFVGRFGK
jgi:hypothetical protein